MIRVILLIGLILSAVTLQAESYISLNEKGNTAYEKGEVKKALDYYHQAEIERPETPAIYYNQANALTSNKNLEEALEKYEKALNTDDVALQQKVHYNTGNALLDKQDYLKAVEAYQKALELNPDDMDAKYNLELARTLLKEQLRRQPQDKKQQQDQQQQQQEQQQQQKQDQQQQNQQQQKEQQDQSENKNQDEQNQPQQQEAQKQPKPDEMTKEDAMRILRAMEDSEKDTQKNLKRVRGTGNYRGKDW